MPDRVNAATGLTSAGPSYVAALPLSVGLHDNNKDLKKKKDTLYPLQKAWISRAAWSSLGSTQSGTGGLGLAVEKQGEHVLYCVMVSLFLIINILAQ